ncbi:TPA: hypothetical protein NJ005_003191 [Vibrio parahaemolyticus]|nr:hypothetical protein [Vibrio parahaemolyticus]
MLSNNLFLRLPRDCVVNNSDAQSALYPENLTPFQMKLVLSFLAQAGMKDDIVNHVEIFLKDFKSEESLFGWVKLSKSKIEQAVINIQHPFIAKISCDDDRINVTFSRQFLNLQAKEMLDPKAVNVGLSALMSYKQVSSIKLHIQTLAYYPYRANFYFLVDFLGVSTNQARKEQIRSIKNKIRTVGIVKDFDYQHPPQISAPRREGDYDFSIYRLKDGQFQSEKMNKRKPGKRT